MSLMFEDVPQKWNSEWFCFKWQKPLAKNADSLLCKRCLKQCHLRYTILKNFEIKKNWYYQIFRINCNHVKDAIT